MVETKVNAAIPINIAASLPLMWALPGVCFFEVSNIRRQYCSMLAAKPAAQDPPTRVSTSLAIPGRPVAPGVG
jgi:hypothetical protein